MFHLSIGFSKKFLFATAILAIFVRFLSIAGVDFHKHGDVLNAYFQHPFRIAIFAIQFMGLFFVFNEIHLAKLPNKVLLSAIIFLSVVSVIRYFVPTLLVCVLGDLLIVWWLHSVLKASYHIDQ